MLALLFIAGAFAATSSFSVSQQTQPAALVLLFDATKATAQKDCRLAGIKFSSASGGDVVDLCGQTITSSGQTSVVLFALVNATVAQTTTLPANLLSGAATAWPSFMSFFFAWDITTIDAYYVSTLPGAFQLPLYTYNSYTFWSKLFISFSTTTACSTFVANVDTDCTMKNACNSNNLITIESGNPNGNRYDVCSINNFASLSYSNATGTTFFKYG